MKITTFNPQIITKNEDEIVKLFEELGFEKRHQKDDIGDMAVKGIIMRNEDNFKIDISNPDAMPEAPDMTSIRMNVDDFDEAYNLLISHGFKNFYGNDTVDTPSSKSALLFAPSGYSINLVKHIKK